MNSSSHRNNFDFLRLLFATLVIITHSYTLSGVAENDFLTQWTNGQINCSSLGVKGFFIISGFLIFQSAVKSKNLLDYMVKRVLRIYPAFLVVLIIGVLVGAVVTDHTLQQYFSDHTTRTYVPVNLALFLGMQYNINGVFETNIYKSAVNGSIWTIPYEFFFYLVLLFVFLIRKYNKLLIACTFLLYCSFFYWIFRHENDPERWVQTLSLEKHHIAHFGLCFIGGSFLAAININHFRYRNIVLLIALTLCIISLCLQQPLLLQQRPFYFAQFILFPVIIIIAGSYSTPVISGLNSKIGDFSYGVYLYAFLIQQTIMHYFKPGYMELIFITIILSFICGALSWHLIEKRALALKKYFP